MHCLFIIYITIILPRYDFYLISYDERVKSVLILKCLSIGYLAAVLAIDAFQKCIVHKFEDTQTYKSNYLQPTCVRHYRYIAYILATAVFNSPF